MKLLVLLDGSPNSEAVLEPAARLAGAAHARVLLLSVLDPLIDAAGVTATSTVEAMEQVTARRQAYLEEQARAFRAAAEAAAQSGDPAVEARAVQLRHGEDVPGCIVRIAQEEGADILVLASKRAAGVTGLILGSVARALLRTGPCPVLVVRPR
jgi:nucleotide-binding universal stress UspA family protein